MNGKQRQSNPRRAGELALAAASMAAAGLALLLRQYAGALLLLITAFALGRGRSSRIAQPRRTGGDSWARVGRHPWLYSAYAFLCVAIAFGLSSYLFGPSRGEIGTAVETGILPGAVAAAVLGFLARSR